jgi:hypothetical protein
MNVLYLALFVDDDSDRNRVIPRLCKHRVNTSDQVFFPGVVLDANWDTAPAAYCGTGFRW